MIRHCEERSDEAIHKIDSHEGTKNTKELPLLGAFVPLREIRKAGLPRRHSPACNDELPSAYS
jgi:hypothetical protein